MPQFDPTHFLSEIIWTLVAFALLFVLLKRLVLPRIITMLDQRTRQMQEEMEQARRLREQAEALHADYAARLKQAEDEARRMFEDSARHAREERAQLMAEWKAEMEKKKRAFYEDMETEKRRAMREIQAQSADLVAMASEKVLRRKVDHRLAEEAVDELLHELQAGASGDQPPKDRGRRH